MSETPGHNASKAPATESGAQQSTPTTTARSVVPPPPTVRTVASPPPSARHNVGPSAAVQGTVAPPPSVRTKTTVASGATRRTVTSSVPPPPPPTVRTAAPSLLSPHQATGTMSRAARPMSVLDTAILQSRRTNTFSDPQQFGVPSSSNTTTTVRIEHQPDSGGHGTMIPTATGETLRSMYTSPEDIRMASQQTRYKELNEEQRICQDRWAHAKADNFAPCPAGLRWIRHETHPGYRCTGGMHYMSDKIIAEGRPAMYVLCCPLSLRAHYTPNYVGEGVPPDYYGPVRPISGFGNQWIYPEWC